jgi:hypothetical protein
MKIEKQYLLDKDRIKEFSALYKYNKERYKKSLNLYDFFRLGDRVKRTHKDKFGKIIEVEGIILAIDKDNVEIYWDTINGKYIPNKSYITFTKCSKIDVFKGNKFNTPIEKIK